MRKITALSFISLMLSFFVAQETWAIKASDLFCLTQPQVSNPQQPYAANFMMPAPMAIGMKHAVKGCGEATDICKVTAKCVYLSPEIKREIAGMGGKAYEALSMVEKVNFLTMRWQQTQFTPPDANPYGGYLTEMYCKGRRDGGQLFCPLPENCKGDTYHQAEFARFEGYPAVPGFHPEGPAPSAGGEAGTAK